MIKECTPDFVNEIAEKVLAGELTSLVITKGEDQKFYASYMLALQPLTDLDLLKTLYAESLLREFASLLAIDKVHDFYLRYIPEDNVCTVNKAYTASNTEITRDVILKKITDQLKSTMTLVKEIDIHEVKVSTLYEKIEKSNVQVNVVNNTQRNKTDNKPRYKEATVESLIEKLLEVLA